MKGRWFCIECNGATGRWDEEYIRLQRALLLHLHDGPDLPRQRLMGPLTEFDPGAFVRSIWAWSFALDPTLSLRYPTVANAVRSGGAVEPPRDLELLLGLTLSLRLWAMAAPDALLVELNGTDQHRRPSGLVIPGPKVESVPVTAVASPPFSVILAHSDRPGAVPHVSVNNWLLDPAGVRRQTYIDLPMTSVIGEDSPRPFTYADFVLALAEES